MASSRLTRCACARLANACGSDAEPHVEQRARAATAPSAARDDSVTTAARRTAGGANALCGAHPADDEFGRDFRDLRREAAGRLAKDSTVRRHCRVLVAPSLERRRSPAGEPAAHIARCAQ